MKKAGLPAEHSPDMPKGMSDKMHRRMIGKLSDAQLLVSLKLLCMTPEIRQRYIDVALERYPEEMRAAAEEMDKLARVQD